MDLSIIISISGKPGLYKVVGRSRNGLIAESLLDQKRIPVRSTDKVSALSDISIFTYEDDLPLKEVLVKMHDHYEGKSTPDKLEDGKWMASELREIIPQYDEERVYSSDLKKLFKWYNLLNDKNLIDKEDPAEEAEDEKVEEKPAASETKKDKGDEGEKKKPAPKAKKPAAKKSTKAKSE